MSSELAGDDALLAELRDRLRRAAARVLPSWTDADRDDVVQQALLRVVRHLQRHPGERPGARWLHRAAHSAMIDELRRRRATRMVPTEEPPDVADPSGGPEGDAQDVELGRAIRDCVAHSVHATRQDPVSLWLLGHSVPESAARLGLSAKQAENLVYRGLAELRECLRGKGFAPDAGAVRGR